MSAPRWTDVGTASVEILKRPVALEKARLAQLAYTQWLAGDLSFTFVDAVPPERPSRPPAPELRLPRDMPRRRAGGAKGRFALLHALAHIELNAIDLAFDMVARFGPEMPRAFTEDWVRIGSEEGKHFNLLSARLKVLDGAYGSLPAHDGLWDAAFATKDHFLARLAIVPMVLEARGLDVTPAMIKKLEASGDQESAEILQVIYEDEKGHVAAGTRWFLTKIDEQKLDGEATFHDLVRTYFKGDLKRPFNDAARTAAGLGAGFYEPLAEDLKQPASE